MSRRFLLPIVMVLVACDQAEPSLSIFEGPSDAAILPRGGVFDVNVAFITNARSGEIAKLDLTNQVPLSDQAYGWWIRGMPIAVGAGRYLDHITVFASDHVENSAETFVTLFASDALRDSLVVVPYLDDNVIIPDDYSCVNAPGGQRVIPARYPLCFQYETLRDVGGISYPVVSLKPTSGSTAQAYLYDVHLNEGFSTTETWTFTWREDFAGFDVVGSMSGDQDSRAVPGVAWEARHHTLGVTVELASGTLREGDTFTLNVDSGVREIEVGGVIQDLAFDPGSAQVLMAVQRDDGSSAVMAVDAEVARSTPSVVEPVVVLDLPEGRLTGIDLVEEGRALYVADGGDLGQVHRVDLSSGDVSSFVATTYDVGFPTVDVALSRDPDAPLLFLAERDGYQVLLYDTQTLSFQDVNTFTPEVDGIELDSPLRGLGASLGKVEMATLDNEGAHPWRYVVTAATYAGNVYTLEADSGCAAFGTPAGATNTSATFIPAGADSNPTLWRDPVTLDAVVTPLCGGITRTELWILRFDGLVNGWRVEGSLSGEQEKLAYSNTRYVSDGGELSVLILDGTQAPSDGDQFRIEMAANLSIINGVNLPEDPVMYQEYVGVNASSDWYQEELRQRLILMINGADTVSLVDVDPNLIDQVIRRFQ